MREETGLIVKPVTLTGVYKNMRLGVVALVFRCRPAGGALTEKLRSHRVQESEARAIVPGPELAARKNTVELAAGVDL
jgi:8-oxo-dGTP diphosphatase